MIALWYGFHRSPIATSLDGNFSRAFASFSLLLVPLWFFAVGAAEPLQRLPNWSQVTIASAFALPYFVFAAGTPAFRWQYAATITAVSVGLSALAVPSRPGRMHWRDGAVIIAIAVIYFLKLLSPAWSEPGPSLPSPLAFFPKLLLADVALYCFLVVRKLEGTGYSLVPSRSGLLVGIRELILYIPIAIVVGASTGFIRFHPAAVSPERAIGAVLITFLLIAIPEELFFRAILQNLLETRFERTRALLLTALLFGLSHFNHGPRFNWKYVLLASIAGIFYGRAWRADRQILASVVTHTAVDVVWSFWFR